VPITPGKAIQSILAAGLSLALAANAGAQTSAPLLQPKPAFVPGLYETESRNSAFQDQPVKSKTCIASADYEAFREETMAQYQKSPQFVKDCQLSETRSLPNGFAFAIQCKGSKTILTFRFGKDMVSSTIENLIVNAPKYSSSILTMMQRVGECPGRESPGGRFSFPPAASFRSARLISCRRS